MADYDDLNKAQNKIHELFHIRDVINNASPYLSALDANIGWYKKLCDEFPDYQNEIISPLEDTIKIISGIEPCSFNVIDASTATGSLYSVSGTTRSFVQSFGSEHYQLITEYEQINKTEDLIDQICQKIASYRSDFQRDNPLYVLTEAKECYAKWKAGSVSNSDLAKDIRAFQDIFYGILHRARCMSHTPIPKKFPEESWPKMSEALAKKSAGCLKKLREMQSEEDKLHLAFTLISKKTRTADTYEMDRLFKDYIEHVYAIVNLINEDLLI